MACNRCDRFIKSSSITASSSDVIITISSAPTLTNLKRFCLVLAQNLPEGANTLPVQISIGGTTYPVYTRTGNLLRADQIRCHRVYPIIFGNDPNHFSLLCCVPNTVYTPPVVVPYVMNMLYSDYYNVLGSDTAISKSLIKERVHSSECTLFY